MRVICVAFLLISLYGCTGTLTPSPVTHHQTTQHQHASTTHPHIVTTKHVTHHHVTHHHNNHHPHVTHEANEHEQFFFRYDPNIHIMVAEIFVHFHKKCYAYKMSRQEQADIYNLSGLRTIEFSVLQQIQQNKTVKPYTHDDLFVRSIMLGNYCKNATIWSVNYIP